MKQIWKKWIKRVICFTMLTTNAIASASAGNKLPILMYHDITSDPSKTNSMTITDERFRLDMEFLQEFGYTAILPEELIQISNGLMEMPEKPVMITFDDGYLSNYIYAYPTLMQTGMKATISVIAYNMKTEEQIESGRHQLAWSEIKEMSDSGFVEIGLHTYNSHNPQYSGCSAPDGINGVMRRNGETQSAYNVRIGGDLSVGVSLIEQNVGKKVNYFSYPFGAYDSWMEPLLTQSDIAISTLTNSGYSDISKGLRRLPRYGINMNRTAVSVLRQQNKAVPTLAAIHMNETETKLSAYNIDGNNYVRVRDVAQLLKETGSEFNVSWDADSRCVTIATHASYASLGTENKVIGKDSKIVNSITEPTIANGEARMIAAYNIDGNTFYKLRSLADICGFYVDWDETNHTVMITA